MGRNVGFWGDFRKYVLDFIDIKQNSDVEKAVEGIKEDISFRGHTSWILVCSILIASLGLNSNSTAVIIGAMLISPLMGPILGMSLSVAINDVSLLKRSVKNFGVMVVLSVISAYLFFVIFPIRDTSLELLARTSPDIRDVLIAFFGGMAITIARMKRGTMASVIFGVAIATALMPPLCTVGFFLAIGDYWLGLGAFYLFFINTVFIGLSAYIVLRICEVPVVVENEDDRKHKMAIRLIYFCSFLVILPAGYTFYKALKESQFKKEANMFIKNNVESYKFEDGKLVKNLSKIEYNDGNPYIELVFFGDVRISEDVKKLWEGQKDSYMMLKGAKLNIISDKVGEGVDSEFVKNLYEVSKEDLKSKEAEVELLKKELSRLGEVNKGMEKFGKISKEVRINYTDVESLSFGNEIRTDFEKTDTISVFRIKWKKRARGNKKEQVEKISSWLRERLEKEVEVFSE